MQRRYFLMTGAAAGVCVLSAHAADAVETVAMNNAQKKPLVVFYSRTGQNYVAGQIVDLKVGNTAALAKTLVEAFDADVYEIRTLEPYPADYRETTEAAKRELAAQARPAIAGELPDLSDRDEIYLGYPIWWGNAPRVILSFVERFSWTGKKVHLFCTHEGSGISGSVSELREKLRGAAVDAALVLPGHRIDERDAAVKRYLARR